MKRSARWLALVVALASITFVVVAVVSVRADHWPAGLLLVIALSWGAASHVVDALCGNNEVEDPGADRSDETAPVTTVIRLGQEPTEVARTTVDATSGAGPVVVVTTGRPDLHRITDGEDIATYVAPTIEEALRRAADDVDTEAVHIVSASAVPVRPNVERAAAELRPGVGWVTGHSAPLFDDGFAPDARDRLGGHLRARARRSGAVLWERDASVVSTKLLREHPIDPGRPWGHWARTLAAEGHSGVQVPYTLSRRAVPGSAAAFWPASVARQHAAVADLADAMRCGSARSRLLAFGLLTRELYVVWFGLWLLAPMVVAWTETFPLDVDAPRFLTVGVGLAAARWFTARRLHGIRLRPLNDALDLAYSAPGSLLAMSAAASKRVRPAVRLPRRPLVWAALGLTVAAAGPLIDRQDATAADGRLVAALAVLVLLVLWLFALRATVQANWNRVTARLPVEVGASIDGRPVVSRDGSSMGVAVVGPVADVPVGSDVTVQLDLDHGSPVESEARVEYRRVRADGEAVLGLRLSLAPADRRRWVRQLLSPVTEDVVGDGIVHPVPRRRAAGSLVPVVADRLAIAAIGVLSVLVVGALALILVGYRPLVVRTASMSPTIEVGDLVLVERVSATAARPGDIITFDDPAGGDETITHRVVTAETDGNVTRLETRGDANQVSEHWSIPADGALHREVLTVPTVGSAIAGLPTARTLVVVATGLTALVVADHLAGARRRPRSDPRRVDDPGGVSPRG